MATFEVSEVDEAADRRRRVRRAAFWSALGVLTLAVGGGLAWYLTPPAMPTSVAEAEALVSSPRFTRLSKKQKLPYQDVIREQFGSLDREKRQAMARENEELAAALREARNVQMEAFLRKFALAPPAERPGMMAEMWQQRRGRPGGGSGGNGGGRPSGDGPSPERAERIRDRIGERITEGSSQTSQLMGEMFSSMRQQREGSR